MGIRLPSPAHTMSPRQQEAVTCVGALTPHPAFLDIQYDPGGASGDAWLSDPWLPWDMPVKDPLWKVECRNAVEPLAARV